MFLTAEFTDAESTAVALDALKAKGLGAEEIDLFSDEPVELPEGTLDRKSHMSMLAVTGAVTICLLAVAFVRFTQYNLPVITGGMPLFSFWGTGVIFYEMTMLGAIAATFLFFLWESGWLQRKRPGPIPALELGRIYLRARCGSDQSVTLGEVLYRAGALSVKRSEGAE